MREAVVNDAPRQQAIAPALAPPNRAEERSKRWGGGSASNESIWECRAEGPYVLPAAARIYNPPATKRICRHQETKATAERKDARYGARVTWLTIERGTSSWRRLMLLVSWWTLGMQRYESKMKCVCNLPPIEEAALHLLLHGVCGAALQTRAARYALAPVEMMSIRPGVVSLGGKRTGFRLGSVETREIIGNQRRWLENWIHVSKFILSNPYKYC
jgi:hypothetical protein